MKLTVEEFVNQTVAAMGVRPWTEEGERFSAFALGILAGSAVKDRIVFPMRFVEQAENCRSMDDVRELETALEQYTGAN